MSEHLADVIRALNEIPDSLPNRQAFAAGARWEAAQHAEEIATATKLGFELGKAEGRKQALEEAAAKLWAFSADPHDVHGEVADGAFAMAAGIVTGMLSQPQEATSEPLTASTGHSDLPEAAKTPEEAL